MDALVSRGLIKAISGDTVGAIQDYTLAIAFDATSSLAYYNRGLLKINQQKMSDGILDFSKAIQQNPTYVKAFLARADAYLQLNDKMKACEDYKIAEKLGDGAAISKRLFTCN